jgi:hypothetical protein
MRNGAAGDKAQARKRSRSSVSLDALHSSHHGSTGLVSDPVPHVRIEFVIVHEYS